MIRLSRECRQCGGDGSREVWLSPSRFFRCYCEHCNAGVEDLLLPEFRVEDAIQIELDEWEWIEDIPSLRDVRVSITRNEWAEWQVEITEGDGELLAYECLPSVRDVPGSPYPALRVDHPDVASRIERIVNATIQTAIELAE